MKHVGNDEVINTNRGRKKNIVEKNYFCLRRLMF